MTGASNINQTIDHRGNTALNALCARSDATVDQVRQLIAAGANLHAVNYLGMPPLGNAIQHASLEVIQCLIEAGAETYFKTAKGTAFNALLLAIACEDKKLTDYFLSTGNAEHINKSGMDASGADSGYHCLHVALKRGHETVVERLIDLGALINVEAGPERMTAFALAVTSASSDTIVKLIRKGADLHHHQSGTGMTPLHMAAQKDRGWALERLIKMGADPSALDNAGMTPLHMAAAHGSANSVRELLAAGVDINQRQAGGDNETPLMIASRKSQSDIIRQLLDKGADPLLTDAFNRTAFRLFPPYGGGTYGEGLLRKAEEAAIHKYFEKQNAKRKQGPKRP